LTFIWNKIGYDNDSGPTASTRFRGGSALDALGSQITLPLNPQLAYSEPRASLTINLFQSGFSINSETKSFHPYNRANMVLPCVKSSVRCCSPIIGCNRNSCINWKVEKFQPIRRHCGHP
jgi:hypothetical protein